MEAVGYMGIRGLIYGSIFGAGFGTLVMPLIGTAYGAFFGAIIGTPLGIIGGMIIGVIASLFFNPVINLHEFRWTLRVMGGVIGFLGASIGFRIVFGPGDNSGTSVVFIHLPTLITTSLATYSSHSYAEYYLRQKRKLGRLDITQ